jgi:FAD synthetase
MASLSTQSPSVLASSVSPPSQSTIASTAFLKPSVLSSQAAIASNPKRTTWRKFDPSTSIQSASTSSDHILSPSSCRPWSPSAYLSACSLYDRLIASEDPSLKEAITKSLDDLNGAYRLYGPEFVVGSYNGGKDAVAIMHLQRAAHAHFYREMQRKASSSSSSTQLIVPIAPRVVYFDNPDEFPEVSSLLDETVEGFDLDMMVFGEGVSFADGLTHIIEAGIEKTSAGDGAISPTETHHLMCFILGTREGDPNSGGQETFAPSSDWMPPFMRVNPVIKWNYGQIWAFLRGFNLQYCTLYDGGYTSLGKVKDSFPNPALKITEGGEGFHPAFMLTDWSKERDGRKSSTKKK